MKQTILLLTFLLLFPVYGDEQNGGVLDHYYAKQIQLEEAWQLTQGDQNVTIATISTGANYLLPEIRNSISYEADGTPGYDAINETMEPKDEMGLGTLEASIISGVRYGIAPESKIIPIKVFGKNGSSSLIPIIRGIDYAISRRAKILVLTFGQSKPGEIPVTCYAVKRAASLGMLVIATAGNDGRSITDTDYPAACRKLDPENEWSKNMLVVGASGKKQELSYFSSYHPTKVDIIAPGEDIFGVGILGTDTLMSGTSISAAVAAGVAALVWSYHPEYSPDMVREAMILGSRYKPTLSGKALSNGILDAYGALTVELE